MAHPGRPRKCDPKVENLRSNIRLNELDIAKQTLKEFGIDATDGEGRTALINSVIENKVDFIHWLIENGANINHQDRIGYSVLHFVGQNQMTDLAKYFLDKGADPNLQDIHGNTPLWTAVFNSKDIKDVVRLFLQSNANPDIQNKYDKTPRIMYKTFYNEDISSLA
jgi:ankyrin repeat protein